MRALGLALLSVFAAGAACAAPVDRPTATPGDEPAAAPRPNRPTDEELRSRLDPLQYHVTQQSGTEPAFHNSYWDNHRAGIYVDIVSGEPLFGSPDKYDSGTGWPSFTRPLESTNVVERGGSAASMRGIEVRSAGVDSHLGHVFPDGPLPTRLRYCINSAALRFIPVEELESEGYARYLPLFSKAPGKK